MFKKFCLKLLYYLSILWGVASVSFLLLYSFPNVEETLLGQRADEQTKIAIRKQLGLDLPIGQQYANYLGKLSPIVITKKQGLYEGLELIHFLSYTIVLKSPDLGSSFIYKQKVTKILKESIPGTLLLALSSMIIALFLGLFLGSLAAFYHEKMLDYVIMWGSTLLISVPSFFTAILIAYIFAYLLGTYTGLPLSGSMYAINLQTGEEILSFKNLILPCIALASRPISIITQLTKSSVLTVLQSDYIRTAKAKGLNKFSILYKHVLKNALNPVVTAASGWFASLMAGAFFVEYIFNWKGIGKVLIESVQNADLPVVSAGVLYIAILFITVNLLVEFSYKKLDPKINT